MELCGGAGFGPSSDTLTRTSSVWAEAAHLETLERTCGHRPQASASLALRSARGTQRLNRRSVGRLMRRLIVVAAVAMFALLARSDHAPEWLVSKAAPEMTLLGISVEGLTLADVESRLGHPQRSTMQSPNEATHEWDLDGVTLWIATMFPEKHDGSAGEKVHAIRVNGKRSHRAATGAGVHLGDGLDRLVKVYGTRYQTAHVPYMSEESATIIFVFSDETELSAGFSDGGKIISLQLAASIE
jgi:hypothetical protein